MLFIIGCVLLVLWLLGFVLLKKTVGAIIIPDSEPGIYAGGLKK